VTILENEEVQLADDGAMTESGYRQDTTMVGGSEVAYGDGRLLDGPVMDGPVMVLPSDTVTSSVSLLLTGTSPGSGRQRLPRRTGGEAYRYCPYCAVTLEHREIEGHTWPVCPCCGFVASATARLRRSTRLIAIVGHSGSGKTTLLENVIRQLAGRGLAVAAIKHDPKGHAAYDHPGKDSWRFRQAGAAAVSLSGPHTVATFQVSEADRRLEDVAAAVVEAADKPVDLVLAEGYHMQTGFPKIEVYRAALGRPPRCDAADLLAVVTDSPAPVPGFEAVPHLPLNDPATVATFIWHAAIWHSA
jgi:molybdopterin-guanine dinucleotide biosynthesis adapter protein